jgi:hypothetical protein
VRSLAPPERQRDNPDLPLTIEHQPVIQACELQCTASRACEHHDFRTSRSFTASRLQCTRDTRVEHDDNHLCHQKQLYWHLYSITHTAPDLAPHKVVRQIWSACHPQTPSGRVGDEAEARHPSLDPHVIRQSASRAANVQVRFGSKSSSLQKRPLGECSCFVLENTKLSSVRGRVACLAPVLVSELTSSSITPTAPAPLAEHSGHIGPDSRTVRARCTARWRQLAKSLVNAQAVGGLTVSLSYRAIGPMLP